MEFKKNVQKWPVFAQRVTDSNGTYTSMLNCMWIKSIMVNNLFAHCQLQTQLPIISII